MIFPVSDFLCPILGPDLLYLEITLSNYQILQTYASVSSLSPTVFLSKKLLQNINNFEFSIQRVRLFPPFNCRKIKEQIAERRNLLGYQIDF